jgi:hypothetical protein
MTNENGYVIYPASIGVTDLEKAREKAAELSLKSGEPTRVEDCDTERVVARFVDGKEV